MDPTPERQRLNENAAMEFHFDYLWVVKPLLLLMCLGAPTSHIRVTNSEIQIAMGWAFNARIPHIRVRSIAKDGDLVSGIGVHGFGSRWLVNGSTKHIVRLELEGVPARVCGFPLTLRTLRLGVHEEEEVIAAVRAEMDR